MKKYKLSLVSLALALTFNGISAQDLFITGTIGWRTNGSFGTGYIVNDGYGKDEFIIDQSVNYNLTFNVPVIDNTEIELFVDHQTTKIHSRSGISLAPFSTFNVANNYYHAGLIWISSSLSSDFYAGGTLGVTHIIPGDPYESAVFFSFGPKVGMRFFISDTFGIDAHSRALLTSISGRDGIFAVDGVPQFYFAGTWLIQIDFSFGLIIAI